MQLELSMSSLLDFGDDDDSFRRRRRRRRSCLISPDDAWLSLWDSFTALTLLFIAGFTPYEVAFLPAPTRYSDGIFILGRVIDFIFLLDMSVQFLTMIPKPDEPDSYEEQHSVIANAYLRGWFPLDAVSIAASLFDFLPFWLAAGDTKLKSLTVLRVVRILRLIKLLRLLKASRVLKSWAVKIPTPRATVTILSSLAECMFVSHMIACLLGLTAELAGSPLDTWLATHGYCTPQTDEDTGALLLDEDDERLFECVPPEHRYLQCFWWAWGMLMGAPISLSAPWGPYTPYYSSGGYELLRIHEQLVVLVLKIMTAFFWTSVIARFVQVYNNLDPDTRDFRMGWDALNRFVSYFKVSKQDALELRRYYIERADLARSKSRKLVMNNFSPHLAEKFVWKLNKEWLMKVPCFSLVVERLISKPQSGMERFLVKVALAMQPAVFVPTERPPAQRLYIVTAGVALFRGKKLKRGDSWGAEDVLLRSRSLGKSHRAVATTYLHALWVGASTFDELREYGHEFREAYMLVKLWATIYATGEAMVEGYRRNQKVKQITIGDGPKQVSVAVLEQKINAGSAKVVALKSESAEQLVNAEGRDLFVFKYPTVNLDGWEIVKELLPAGDPSGKPFVYRVQPSAAKRYATAATDGGNIARVAQQAISKKEFLAREGYVGGSPAPSAAASGGGGGRSSGFFEIALPEQDPAILLASQLAQMQATFTANTEVMAKQLALMAKQVEALKKARKDPNGGGVLSA